jgi:RNase P subunit RPR2
LKLNLQIKTFPHVESLICSKCLELLENVENFRMKLIEAEKYFETLSSDQKYELNDREQNEVYFALDIEPFTRSKKRSKVRPICRFCGKLQESQYRLRQHELMSHTPLIQIQPEELYICDKCGRNFKTKQSIRNHFIRSHTPKDEIFPCSVCGKVSSLLI